MKYSVLFTEKALKKLKKLAKPTSILITSWIWHYRIGNYRLLAKINQSEIVILILSVGHRKDIYRL